jgi:hypothetical protein
MVWGPVLCTLACTAAIPALAGDKPARSTPGAVAIERGAKPLAYGSPGTAAQPAIRFSEPRKLDVIRLSGTALPQPRRFDYADAPAQPDWRVTDVSARTAEDGGRYAVGDYFSSQRKPRFRRSALGALLVFKIDGEDDSPPLSVGGGGVASAVWQALPK